MMEFLSSVVTLCSLFGGLVLFPTSVYSEVGVKSQNGVALEEVTALEPDSWSLGSFGCSVGAASNLVVSPLGERNAYGGESFDLTGVGSQLCTWLTMMSKAHNSLLGPWEAAHTKRKSAVSRLNIFRRLYLWMKKFPKLRIEVKTRYLDLWNLDFYGHPLPWIISEFAYKCPEDQSNFALFEHLCDSYFSLPESPQTPAQVTLLLHPRQGFDVPLDVKSRGWNYVSGALAGMAVSERREPSSVQANWMLAKGIYSRLNSIMTISGVIDDFWSSGMACYFKWLLRIEWRLFTGTVCHELHAEAGGSLLDAFKAATVKSVHIFITGSDLFNQSRPTLYGWLDEGVLTTNVSSELLYLEVDTDPENIPHYETTKAAAQASRAAGLVASGVKSVYEIYKKNQRAAGVKPA